MIFAAESSSPSLDRRCIRIDPVSAAFAVEAERRNHRHDALVKQQAQRLDVHAFDASGKLVVRAAENSGGMGDDCVDISGPQVHGGEALHDLVGQADCRVDADLQRNSSVTPVPSELVSLTPRSLASLRIW